MPPNAKPRLEALDLLRGMAVAGMILVVSPGDWDQAYSQLQHAAWNGATAADMVFPAFLFSVGAALEAIGYRGECPAAAFPLHACYEVHIEQGPILEDEAKIIGIVQGVLGIRCRWRPALCRRSWRSPGAARKGAVR